MENIYERLTDLLGKQPSAPEFDEFVRELGEKPNVLVDRKDHHREISFDSSGVFVGIDLRQGQIKSLFFHLKTAAVQSGWISPYSGNLPAEIVASDSRADVAKKLGVEPNARRVQGRTKLDPKDYRDYFLISPLQLTFMFDGQTEQLAALSVDYTIDQVL